MRKLLLVLMAILVVGAAGAGAVHWYLGQPVQLPGGSLDLDVPPGATLQQVARDLQAAGVGSARLLPLLGRVSGTDRALKAGRYRFESGLTLRDMLEVLASGRVVLATFTIVEGWRFDQLKDAIRTHPDIVKTALDVPDSELLRLIGADESHPEGLFFPETYRFASGTTDVSVLKRAYSTMRERLADAWDRRAPDLPYAGPYDALIMASIIEKETGSAHERGLVASVFVNRLRRNMKLQTDPAVIYGLGKRFDGNLRRQDLVSDTAYNTYTRAGLPPTPIALPGQAALDAATQPSETRFLYFVAKGDGTSEFSTNLPDHNRAVAKYQRGGRPAANAN